MSRDIRALTQEEFEAINMTLDKLEEMTADNKYIKENRDRRVQAYFTPSLHEDGKAKAEQLGISFNDLLNRVLAEYLTKDNSKQ